MPAYNLPREQGAQAPRPARVNYFLHVLTATDATVDAVERLVLEEMDSGVRVRIGKAVISFGKSEVAGSVEIGGDQVRCMVPLRDVQLGKLALNRMCFGVGLLTPFDAWLPGC